MAQNDRKRLLIIGGSGLVGSRVKDLLDRSFSIVAPSHTALDITNGGKVSSFIRHVKPTTIVNFAVIIRIDTSEKERNDNQGNVWKVNVDGVKHIIRAMGRAPIRLLQISTDAVFPGTLDNPGPYAEDDQPSDTGKGINWYGFTKRIAEKEVETLGNRGSIIRISHPFGNLHASTDLIKKTASDIKDGQAIFADQFFTPTYIPDLAVAIQSIIEQRAFGIFHVSCFPRICRYTFARYLAKRLHPATVVRKESMQKYVRRYEAVPRTRLGGLLTAKTRQRLGVTFHFWQDAIDECLVSTTPSK